MTITDDPYITGGDPGAFTKALALTGIPEYLLLRRPERKFFIPRALKVPQLPDEKTMVWECPWGGCTYCINCNRFTEVDLVSCAIPIGVKQRLRRGEGRLTDPDVAKAYKCMLDYHFGLHLIRLQIKVCQPLDRVSAFRTPTG